MAPCYNPSLSEEPRNQKMKVISSIAQESLLDWLESKGRLRSNEIDELQDQLSEDLDDFLEPEAQLEEDEEEAID